MATLAALVPLASTLPTSGPLAPTPANTSIYPIQSQCIGPKSAAYIKPPSIGSPFAAYTPLSTEPIFATYMQPLGIGLTITAYTQLAGIKYTPASYNQTSTGSAYLAVYYPLSASHSLAAMVTTSIGHSRELSNLAEIYRDKAKYSSCNDSFIFPLVIFYDIYSSADVSLEAKMKEIPTMFKSLALDYYSSNISINGTAINSN